ncbi:MAG: hypothetical protein CBD31_03955 [Flavobacteriaceae bacterium TMED171]|nr:hypothetical protein [Flavobacteriaceae bacterium]OUW31552.1 MAG: hypothetical protein CBD31_03955 [Flavobacteriaceae bacterium TMED171]|tara:strand:+ start:1925 stop:2944 length:1020 start_codon:yes stop_codon:yes gene_type:complete
MNKQMFFILGLLITSSVCSQVKQKSDLLFEEQNPLKIKLSYSNKVIRLKTDDTTYVKTNLNYWYNNKWNDLQVSLRARGNFRRSKCYFPPIKMKIKKSKAEGTLFEGNKNLKLVVPCLMEKERNDNIIQEFIAYKFYEKISPYHFKTRMVDIEFTEIKKSKTIVHNLKGFLIEDDKRVADRFEGKSFERYIHPKAMDNMTSVQYSMFQFMIGNTDFSVAYQHNGKLLYVDKIIYPLPYDFDLCGLVDASYAIVNSRLGISSVRDRKYRGFKRDESLLYDVKEQILSKKTEFFQIIDSQQIKFEMSSEFESTREYLTSFFDILEDDDSFEKEIIQNMRTK